MSTEVKRTLEKIRPLDLVRGEKECQYICVARVRAICGEYVVWQHYEKPGAKAYVLFVPTDGPVELIQNQGRRLTTAEVFSADDSEHKNNWRVFDAAIQFAMKSASDDVLDEYY